MKYLSCKDIEGSLYIAPNEIRSCCQRFFSNNKMRGDAKLLEIKEELRLKWMRSEMQGKNFLKKFKIMMQRVVRVVLFYMKQIISPSFQMRLNIYPLSIILFATFDVHTVVKLITVVRDQNIML